MINHKMTEEAAKEKWCRYSRAEGEVSTYNRPYPSNCDSIPAECKCIGTKCMHFIFVNIFDGEAYYRCSE